MNALSYKSEDFFAKEILDEVISKGGLYGSIAKKYEHNPYYVSRFIHEFSEQCETSLVRKNYGQALINKVQKFIRTYSKDKMFMMNYLIYNRKLRLKKGVELFFSIPVRIDPAKSLFHVELDEMDVPQALPIVYFNFVGLSSQKKVTVKFEMDAVRTSKYLRTLDMDLSELYLFVGCTASELLFFTLTVEIK